MDPEDQASHLHDDKGSRLLTAAFSPPVLREGAGAGAGEDADQTRRVRQGTLAVAPRPVCEEIGRAHV